jgi:hypothetical protein
MGAPVPAYKPASEVRGFCEKPVAQSMFNVEVYQ